MKKIYLLIIATVLISGVSNLNAQTVWTGPVMTFTKENHADWTVAANQDRITDVVWITRADTMGIFNIASEVGYSKNLSPSDTEWAFGTTADIASLTFQSWQTAINSKPLDMVNNAMVLHLISEDIYIDIKFTAWSKGADDGGGYSYERSTNSTTGNSVFGLTSQIKIFPNPTEAYLQISGLINTTNFEIYNIAGKRILEGNVSGNQKISVMDFSNGVYYLKLDNKDVFKFVKR